jgi:hypothetical protein
MPFGEVESGAFGTMNSGVDWLAVCPPLVGIVSERLSASQDPHPLLSALRPGCVELLAID